MKYYEDFLKLGCFSFEEAVDVVGLEATAKSLLQQYTKKGYVVKIKKGLYAAVNLLDREPVPNKFVIATKVTETAVVSHHSAFEFYGYTNQVSYNMTVTSESKFNDFEFNGFHYTRLQPAVSCGIAKYPTGECVTDIERTVLDCINDFEKNMGFEELIQCISAIPFLNEKKMLTYLEEYNKCFLYQKTGFIMEHFKYEFDISATFLKICKTKSGNSSRYLMKGISKDNMDFNNNWHLTIPHNLWRNIVGGGDEDAEI